MNTFNAVNLILFFNIVVIFHLIFFSSNTVNIVFSLILVFLSAYMLGIINNIEFIAFLYILIYVGAIAVLFIFVIMMIPTKDKKSNFNNNLVFIAILALLLFFFSKNLITVHGVYSLSEISTSYNSDIYIFGQFLYNYYYITVIIAGIILLIPIVGAVTLTLSFKNIKSKFKTNSIIENRKKSRSSYINYSK